MRQNDSSMSEGITLGKGTLVTVAGLQSEAGKKLNGSQGIVLNRPSITQDGVTRYPVRLYASILVGDKDEGVLKLVDETTDKKIKLENLEEAAYSDLFSEAVTTFAFVAVKAKSTDDKYVERGEITAENLNEVLFWLEAHYNLNPGHVRLGIMYANFLRETGKIQKGFEVAQPYVDQLDDSNPTLYNTNCYDLCAIFTAAGERMEEALELALKIPVDKNNPGSLKTAQEILRNFCERCRNMRSEDYNNKRPEVSTLHIKAAKCALEREPDDAFLQQDLAIAHCLGGNNLEGAKQYRRVLALGKMGSENVESAKKGLVLAQLQCPGQPLENYFVISCVPPSIYCVAEEDRQFVINDHLGLRVEGAEGHQVRVERFKIPEGPDDPEFFSADFLAQLQPAS